MKVDWLAPKFVEFVPRTPEPGTLYISEKYHTAVHLCACGCGRRVVTPLGPMGWKVRVAGAAVTLHPSVGNWNFPCQAHYWIRGNRVVWAPAWSQEQITAGRAADQRRSAAYYSGQEAQQNQPGVQLLPSSAGFWKRLWNWLCGNA